MVRTLRWAASVLLVLTVALWLGDAVSWIPKGLDDRWSGLTLKAALAALAAALVLSVVMWMLHHVRQGRCTVCGRTTERGHVYCLDHLQETVNNTRDRTRDRATPHRPSSSSVGPPVRGSRSSR